MPITSKYNNKDVERILDQLVDVLEENNATAELSLMLVGNIATNILNQNVPQSQRKAITDKFVQALLTSIDD
ncbi:DUF1414 domain-containing protein [Vibrio sp. SS-MA-C1-2]|uniref:DUF1414 domain-containing protein n=1 Tax=Vibrio sp. SS-MA-C1-2 TaxID=2908646 RepID=UPI001F168B92|nr:DUF1414 domain-containing protein [Vibrio sp. SS-MA-C1-2]UJF19862.1 DUF1414 domain-containing protein [Vibrio sp. SS-MA-C1-2]